MASIKRSKYQSKPESYSKDIQMDDEELAYISTVKLNAICRKYKIPKQRQLELKKKRRTIKNRGK